MIQETPGHVKGPGTDPCAQHGTTRNKGPLGSGSCLPACLLVSPNTMLTDWWSWFLSSLEQYFMRSLFY